MNTKPAALAAAGTVLLWASAFPAITVAVRGLGPAGLAVARLAVASAALAVAAPLIGVRRPKLGDLPLIALCGLAGMTGYQLLLNAGERVVPAGTASLLVATAPVYASLLAVAFLGERATRRHRASQHWAGSAVALAGTALIAASHGRARPACWWRPRRYTPACWRWRSWVSARPADTVLANTGPAARWRWPAPR